jgi:hypothetical protein
MTEADAGRLALEFVQARQLPVSGMTTMRRIRLNYPHQGLRDVWVVCFATKGRGDPAEYQREIIVEVRDDTGEITIFGSGSRGEI